MHAYSDRTAEFRALTAAHRGVPKAPGQRRNLYAALAADELPPEQARRVVLAELEHARLTAPNDQALLHWCEAERLFAAAPALERRQTTLELRQTTAVTRIQRDLELVSRMYDVVTVLVANQSVLIGALERNASTIRTRIDASADELSDAAPRVYRSVRWRCCSMGARLRCIVAVALLVNLVLVGALAR
jgi:hypothetical protein